MASAPLLKTAWGITKLETLTQVCLPSLFTSTVHRFNHAKFGWIPIVLPVNPVSVITLNMAMLCDEDID